MIRQESRAWAPLRVQGQLLTLPKWLVEVASERGIQKATTLLEAKRSITNFHVTDGFIHGHVKGSNGNYYSVAVGVFDEEQGQPATSCNCHHGLFGTKGICYHKIALVLLWVLKHKPQSIPRVSYEDDFELED